MKGVVLFLEIPSQPFSARGFIEEWQQKHLQNMRGVSRSQQKLRAGWYTGRKEKNEKTKAFTPLFEYVFMCVLWGGGGG